MEVDIPQNPHQKTTNPVLEPQKPAVMKKFPGAGDKTKNNALMFLTAFVVVGLGILTGWLLSGSKATTTNTQSAGEQQTVSNKKAAEGEEGNLDDAVEYGEVEGKLVEGGIKGEGTHHIERDNNPSRYVYLSSTAIDLDKYVDKTVHVWGETISSVNAPWLMDVVKIKSVD